jgi:hypothetical protein
MSDHIHHHDRDRLREEWRLKALEWSAAEDMASRLEEGRATVLARLVLDFVDTGYPVSKAEKMARIEDEYTEYVNTMHQARRVANDARIERDNADRLYWHHATAEANQRAEMRLSR